MSFRAADLIKRHIVQIDTGLIVGHVEDLIIDPDLQRIMALVTVSPLWKREATVLHWDEVRVASGDVILVTAGAEPQPISVHPELQALVDRGIRLNGTTVIAESGVRYGSIHDVMLDEDGSIIGYILSYGFLGTDRRYVAASAIKAIGPDAVVALDGSLRELGDIQPRAANRVILPFSPTAIAFEESQPIDAEPVLMGLPEPLPPSLASDEPVILPESILNEAEAIAEGEALITHLPLEVPPVTSQASAGEMLLDVALPTEPPSELSTPDEAAPRIKPLPKRRRNRQRR